MRMSRACHGAAGIECSTRLLERKLELKLSGERTQTRPEKGGGPCHRASRSVPPESFIQGRNRSKAGSRAANHPILVSMEAESFLGIIYGVTRPREMAKAVKV